MLSIIVPTYNEEKLLSSSIATLHSYLDDRHLAHEIVIADNGSTDSTPQIAAELTQSRPWLKLVSSEVRGVGEAFKLGVQAAESEFIVCLDADLSSDMVFCCYAHDLLQHADMVVGSKTMGKQRRAPIRIFASQAYILFTQLVFSLAVSDFSVGSKAFRKTSILPALPFLDSWTGYTLELCLFLEAGSKRIIQIGVDCIDTRESRFNILHEGFYRYAHLYRCWKLRNEGSSWLYTAQ